MNVIKSDSLADEYADVQTVDDLIARIGEENCVPGWVQHERPLMWAKPASVMHPAHWRYAKMKPALIAAGRVIGTDLAERRNFVLRNPAPGNDFATTRTLVGAYQSILPGERARSHRHSPHALRVIIESKGSYSVVNGRKHPMETGDIVLTPGGNWHGHGHAGDEQAFWFDCLDIPLVHLLEPMSYREHPEHWERDVIDELSSPMRFAWMDILAMMDAQAQRTDVPSLEEQGCFGTTITLDAPSMPTIDIKVHRLTTEWQGHAYEHNASSVCVVLQGSGTSAVGESRFEWEMGDVMAFPMGVRLQHAASNTAIVVELTDEKLMRYCCFYQRHLIS
jgi:gentisate 1,2-dioxygenase